MNGISGMYSLSNVVRTRIELKNADGTSAGSITFTKVKKNKTATTKKTNNNGKKKKLHYNFKELSAQIMQSKTSGGASRVLLRARAKAAMLKRKLYGGEYDDQELKSAILHAEAIARVAKKRVKHLREEEDAKRQGGPCEGELVEKQDQEKVDSRSERNSSDTVNEVDQEELQRLMREYKRLMREAEKAMAESIKDTSGLGDLSEEVSDALSEDMDPADLELMKKKHRAKELREIMEADMKYLRAMFDKLAKEKQANASGSIGSSADSFEGDNVSSGVILELSEASAPVEIAVPAADAAAVVESGAIDVTV